MRMKLLNSIKKIKYKSANKIRRLRYKSIYERVIYPRAANLLIRGVLDIDSPLMVTRLGATEADCVDFFLTKRPQSKYKPYILHDMSYNSGFFSMEDYLLDKFSNLCIDSIKQADVLGIWYVKSEGSIIKKNCPNAHLVDLKSLEPYYHRNPWSKKLEGKKVLVVHPFAESILDNYISRREKLFNDSDVLPQFELIVIKAVQSIAGNKNPFKDWFEAYEYMCSEISKNNFDIAIIGCGAYGLPLAAFVKKLGKKAIHLGGATQILFGIKGKRWDESPFFRSLYNQYWTRPKDTETPSNFQEAEGGGYW